MPGSLGQYAFNALASGASRRGWTTIVEGEALLSTDWLSTLCGSALDAGTYDLLLGQEALRAAAYPVDSWKTNGRNDMRASPIGIAVALLTTAVAAGIASAQSSYSCTETSANPAQSVSPGSGLGLTAAAMESGQCCRGRSEQ
jgi:hypothetical protein